MSIKNLDDLRSRIESMDEEETVPEVKEEVEVEPEVEPEVKEEVEPEVKEEVEPEVKEEEEEEEVADVEDEVVQEEEEKPKYKPESMKYKAMKEEFELPEYLAAVIDSPEKEEEIKKIFSKAKGLDHFTQKNEMLKNEINQYVPIIDSVKQFNSMLDKGQIHAALKVANIDDDTILKLAGQIIQVRELTPQQQNDYNNTISSHQQLHKLELQNQKLQEQFLAQEEQGHVQQLDNVLVSDSVSSVSQIYDQRAGRNGAFREAVINHAAMIEFQTMNRPEGPQVLTPQEAVEQVIRLSGITLQQAPQVNVQSTPQVKSTETRVVAKSDKPTLPSVQGGGKSPVKQKVKTLDDLKKLAAGLDDY